MVAIEDLDRATEADNALFVAEDFVNFLATPTFPELLINFVPLRHAATAIKVNAPDAEATGARS